MKKPLIYLSLLAALSLAACTNENTAPEQDLKEDVVKQTPKRELVYTLNGEEVVETDVNNVKINNTNIKMIIPSSYTYSESNSVSQDGTVGSYSISVSGKENEKYEGTRFFFENALSEDSIEVMDRKIEMSIPRLGLGYEYELQKIDSSTFDIFYKMIVPEAVVYLAAKTFEGNTHYLNAVIYDPEKLDYEDYLLKVFDSIEFVSKD